MDETSYHISSRGPEQHNQIAAVYEIFASANAHGGKPTEKLFTIELAGSKTVNFEGGLFTATPHVHISAITKTNLVIIPSVNSHSYLQAHLSV